jgi:hypothetical protein
MLVVGRIFFVNGLIGGGSPPAGKPYWNRGYADGSPFVRKAKGLFASREGGVYHEPSTYYSTYAFDPAQDHLVTGRRVEIGRSTAARYGKEITKYLDPKHHSLVFVTHSMGAAYSEGMMSKLKEDGWFVSAAIHLNPFQPAYIHLSEPRERTGRTIHYQNPDDPVTREVGGDWRWAVNILSPVLAGAESGVKGAGWIDGAIRVEHPSGLSDLRTIHASPEGDATTWDRISPYLLTS